MPPLWSGPLSSNTTHKLKALLLLQMTTAGVLRHELGLLILCQRVASLHSAEECER
jgi:hypothetical protein